MVEHHFDVFQIVIPPQRLVQRGKSPMRHAIRIRAVFDEIFDAFAVVPVSLAEQHGRQRVRVGFPAFHDGFERGVVPTFRRVIGHFAVVWIRAPLQQQARQPFMMCDAGRAIEHTFPPRLWLVIHLEPTRVRAGTGVEQRASRLHETIRALAFETKIFGEAKISKRIPAARADFRCCAGRGEFDEPAHRHCVAQNCRRLDGLRGDFGMCGENFPGAVERAGRVPAVERNARRRDELRKRIVCWRIFGIAHRSNLAYPVACKI